MIDIQKERAAFEKLPLAELAMESEYVYYDEKTNSYWPNEDFCPADAPESMNFAWSAWQAAKAQAMPDGFVLVPKINVHDHYVAEHLKNTTCSVDVSELTGSDGDRIYGKLRSYDCLGSDGNTLLYDLESSNFKLQKSTGNLGDFVLVPKAEPTGLTDKNGKLIFVGNVVEFVGGCRDFLDLSGCGSPKYIVNKGDKMVVRKLKSGYTLSLPWIDCDTPNRFGNLGNYEFWNLHRDFVVVEAQE